MSEEETEYVEKREIAGELIARYFENLFTAGNPQDCDDIFEGLPRTINETMNRKLTRPVEDYEIKQALFVMHPNKARDQMVCLLPYFKYIRMLLELIFV